LNFTTVNNNHQSVLTAGAGTSMTVPTGTTFNALNGNTLTGFDPITNNGSWNFIQTLGGVQTHNVNSDIHKWLC